jgi:hypothetical protein
MAAAATEAITPSPAAHQALTWRRLVLLLALLNAPLYFNGCDSKATRFSAGAAIPFAELAVQGQPPLAPMDITWWSPWRCGANFVVLGGVIWLASRHVGWIARLARSRWFVVNLVLVALVFNSWLYLPQVCFQLVIMPTLNLAAYLQSFVEGDAGLNEAIFPYVVSLSARLYYIACVAGVGGIAVGLRVFFRRYFFVPSGHGWQVQLGGLITVVLVVGTAIGLIARLLTQR